MLGRQYSPRFAGVAFAILLSACNESPGGGLDAGLHQDAQADDAMVLADTGPVDMAFEDTSVPFDLSVSDGPYSDAADAASPADASDPADAGVNSRCTETPSRIACSYSTRTLRIGSTALTDRDVHYELPNTPAPAGGYPVVIAFQGSFNSAELVWDSSRNAPFGRYFMSDTIKELLDRGYAIVTPEAHIGGATFWDTNVPPYAIFWETSNDHRFMELIFEDIEAGRFGNLDASRLYATGISSGGYMTSRMAVSYPGRFKALAIHSGSYATCGGALCILPSTLPADHPPTLFAHGAADLIVPISTMQDYADQLIAEGFAIDVVVNQDAGHVWIEEATLRIATWFDAHP